MKTIFSGGRAALWLLALLFPILAFAQPGPRVAPGADGHFLQLAHDVPGFGGYFFDANGDLNVYLTDLKQEPAARAAVADVARNRSHGPWAAPAKIVVRRGDFDFKQLSDWRARFAAAGLTGVTMIDTDESRNRIAIGVADNAAMARVLSQLAAAGVPRDAAVVEIVPPLVTVTNLTQYSRPLIGGLQIDWNGTYCTLGANAWYSNFAQGISGAAGFFTASHCSTTQASTDGTVYSQGGVRIASERYDPPFFTHATYTACPAGWNCRHSDATFAQYDAGTDGLHGGIAQTQYRGFGPGPGTSGSIDMVSPNFTIVGGQLPVQGNYMDKVGRTTGWTSGQVVHTCADYPVAGGIDILCQDEVAAFADGGDSGSPSFTYPGGSNNISFGGIVWAKTSSGHFVLSNTDRIGADFGIAINFLSF